MKGKAMAVHALLDAVFMLSMFWLYVSAASCCISLLPVYAWFLELLVLVAVFILLDAAAVFFHDMVFYRVRLHSVYTLCSEECASFSAVSKSVSGLSKTPGGTAALSRALRSAVKEIAGGLTGGAEGQDAVAEMLARTKLPAVAKYYRRGAVELFSAAGQCIFYYSYVCAPPEPAECARQGMHIFLKNAEKVTDKLFSVCVLKWTLHALHLLVFIAVLFVTGIPGLRSLAYCCFILRGIFYVVDDVVFETWALAGVVGTLSGMSYEEDPELDKQLSDRIEGYRWLAESRKSGGSGRGKEAPAEEKRINVQDIGVDGLADLEEFVDCGGEVSAAADEDVMLY